MRPANRVPVILVYLCSSVFICGFSLFLATAGAQDWFRTGTGLGVEKARVAVADFGARNAPAAPLARLFTEVLSSDLDYSGIVEIVSRSFHPLEPTSVPAQLKHAAWSEPPASAHLLAFGNLAVNGEELIVEAWLYDVRNPAAPPILAKRYRGEATEEDTRRLAHLFADEIVMRLSGGLPGIASTKIAYVSNRTGAKEIWVMDYDGAGQRRLTAHSSLALTPRFSPDGRRIAYTCYVRVSGVLRPQICLHSLDTGRNMAFPQFRGTNSAPSWSPEGGRIAFSSDMFGSPQIFVIDSNGQNLRRLTYSNAADTSPVWNPKTAQQVAFVSDRAGAPQLYIMNADGTNTERIALPDMGYVIDPSWSPNGQMLAFSWQRPTGNYDIYVMDIGSRALVELTRDSGRNERPSWAPDGRHIVFESTRTGRRQIYSMLADGSRQRQLTFEGANESPNWSPR